MVMELNELTGYCFNPNKRNLFDWSGQSMLIIDRFEGEWAVLEMGRRTFNFPKSLLPAGAREGDVLDLKIAVDRKATADRKMEIDKISGGLFRK